MASTDLPREMDAPPKGEELHLPNPTIVPILNAFAISIALVGLTTIRFLTWAGIVLFLVTTIWWIRDSRRELDQLPAEHAPH